MQGTQSEHTPRRAGFLRRLFTFKPMAILVALSILPPELTNWSLVQRAEAATAPQLKLPSNCRQNGGQFLIQLICKGDIGVPGSPPPIELQEALRRWETESI